jgi:flagellar biogenesis protein FliO
MKAADVTFVASRLAAAPPRTRALLVAGAAAAALLLALAEDPILATSGRAALVAVAVGAVAWLVRRRGSATASPTAIDVAERRNLSREAAVALLHVGGRALLVGYGPEGVRLLADLGAAPSLDGEVGR